MCLSAAEPSSCWISEAFNKAKSLIHSSSFLVYYNGKKPLVLSCDASIVG